MLHSTTRLAALAAGCLLAVPALLIAQELPPEPHWFIGDQAYEQPVAALQHTADGTALTLWYETGTDPSGADRYRLFARRHRGIGTPEAPLIDVAEQAIVPVRLALQADDQGWTAAWDGFDPDTARHVVRARDFDAQDQPRAVEYALNTLPGRHWLPDVALGGFGTRAFVWEGIPSEGETGIYARVFRLDDAMPQEVRLNDDAVRGGDGPKVALLGNGEFLAVWSGSVAGSDSVEIVARRFDGNGIALGAPYVLSDLGGDHESDPSLAVDATGQPVVAWEVFTGRLRLRLLDTQGQLAGPVIDAPKPPGETQITPAVTRDADGDIALGFVAYDNVQGTGYHTWLQRFDAAGNPGARDAVSTDQSASHFEPAVSSDVDGDVFFAWETRDYWQDRQRVALRHLRGPNTADLSLSFTDNEVSVAAQQTQIYVARVRHEGLPGGVPGEGDTSQFSVSIELAPHALVQGIHQMDWSCGQQESYFVITVHCRFEGVLSPGEQTYPVVVYATPPSWATTVRAAASLSPMRHPDPAIDNNAAADETYVGDVDVDPFTLVDRSGVPRWASQASDPVVPTGYDVPVKVSVSNGEYSIDDGPWTGEPGVLWPGRSVRVRHDAASGFSTLNRTFLYVGPQMETFETVTEVRDNLADPFVFADLADAALGATATSNLVTITGINDATPISVSGGSFSINGGTWRTHPGHAYNGDVVKVQHVASSTHGTRTDTVLTVGTVSDTFSSTTIAADTTPDPYAFPSQSNLPRSTVVTSAAAAVTGINVAAPISVSGGSYSINGGAFTTSAGVVRANDTVRVQHVSAAGFSAQVVTTLSIGGVPAAFASTTAAADTMPDAFSFADASGKKNRVVTSLPVTVSGINAPAAIAVSGGGARWSKNGGAFTTAPGTVANGDQVRLQITTPPNAGVSVNVQVDIGGIVDTWTVRVTN